MSTDGAQMNLVGALYTNRRRARICYYHKRPATLTVVEWNCDVQGSCESAGAMASFGWCLDLGFQLRLLSHPNRRFVAARIRPSLPIPASSIVRDTADYG